MTIESLQDFYLSFDFAPLDRLQCLDHNLFIIVDGHSGVNFGVLALANFGDDLEPINFAA
jgi:hypothetical protein